MITYQMLDVSYSLLFSCSDTWLAHICDSSLWLSVCMNHIIINKLINKYFTMRSKPTVMIWEPFDKQVTKQHHSVSFLNLKYLKYTFCREFYSQQVYKFFDDNVISVMLSVHRTQFTRVLFSPPVIYHNSQVTNSIWPEKMYKLNKLTPSL